MSCLPTFRFPAPVWRRRMPRAQQHVRAIASAAKPSKISAVGFVKLHKPNSGYFLAMVLCECEGFPRPFRRSPRADLCAILAVSFPKVTLLWGESEASPAMCPYKPHLPRGWGHTLLGWQNRQVRVKPERFASSNLLVKQVWIKSIFSICA